MQNKEYFTKINESKKTFKNQLCIDSQTKCMNMVISCFTVAIDGLVQIITAVQ